VKLKIARVISIIPIITAFLAAGCNVREVHMGLGILTLITAVVTTISLFLLKEE